MNAVEANLYINKKRSLNRALFVILSMGLDELPSMCRWLMMGNFNLI